MKDWFIELCLALYRVTELFPQKEPLKFSLREKANEILADLVLVFSENPIILSQDQKRKIYIQILNNIEILQFYFEIAQHQKWVKELNFLVLKKEYQKIKNKIIKLIEQKEKSVSKNPPLQFPLEKQKKERYKKILEILKEQKRVQIRDLKEFFPNLTKRTLRRYLEDLRKKNLVERRGEGITTWYQLKINYRTILGQINN